MCGDLSFFCCCFELSNKFLSVNKYGSILRVEQKNNHRGNVNLASNRDYNLGAIIRIYKQGADVAPKRTWDPTFLFQNLSSLHKQSIGMQVCFSAGPISVE